MSRRHCYTAVFSEDWEHLSSIFFVMGYQAAIRLFCWPLEAQIGGLVLEMTLRAGSLGHVQISREGQTWGQCWPVSHRPNCWKANPSSGRDQRCVKNWAPGLLFAGSWVKLGRCSNLSESFEMMAIYEEKVRPYETLNLLVLRFRTSQPLKLWEIIFYFL